MSNAGISGDLIWEIVRNQNAFLVKRKSAGGAQFSRDPFNLTNKHSRKHAGFVNDKAVSVQPNEEKGVAFSVKKTDMGKKPALAHSTHKYGSKAPNRKVYKSLADGVGKNSYRSDLTSDAVSRASAIRASQRSKKDRPAKKARGAAARRAAAA